jgi:hypothetical protein
MLLKTLKTKLQIVNGTTIGEVFVDYKKYQNITRSINYPYVLWMLDNMKFVNDIRPNDIQNIKEFTVTAFAVALYDSDTEDKFEVWDDLETAFNKYLNTINSNDQVIQIMSVNNIKGEYLAEGSNSANKDLAIMFNDILIRTYCDETPIVNYWTARYPSLLLGSSASLINSLSWTNNVIPSVIDGICIERCTDNKTFVEIELMEGEGLYTSIAKDTYKSTFVEPLALILNTTYYYRVRYRYNGSYSDYSNTRSLLCQV